MLFRSAATAIPMWRSCGEEFALSSGLGSGGTGGSAEAAHTIRQPGPAHARGWAGAVPGAVGDFVAESNRPAEYRGPGWFRGMSTRIRNGRDDCPHVRSTHIAYTLVHGHRLQSGSLP